MRLFSTLMLLCASATAVAAPAAVAPSLPQVAAAADKGDAAAMLQLGEMYWYGNGAPLDRARGDALFARAAAAGNKQAVAAMALSAQRRQHLDDIAYWTSRYDGSDLAAARSACAAPVIPAESKSIEEARAVDTAYEAYRSCYNEFVDKAYTVPASRIPKAVAEVMSDEEFGLASSRLNGIYRTAQAGAAEQAAAVAAARARWADLSVANVSTHAARRQLLMADWQRYARDRSQQITEHIRTEPTVRVAATPH
jgi:hypothetical protein